MKFATLFAFSALLGFSVANATQVIQTGAEKRVWQLIDEYEKLIGGIGPEERLFARRRGRHYGSNAQSQVPVSGSVPAGLVITDNLDDDPFAAGSGSITGRRVPTDGYKIGDLVITDDSKGKGSVSYSDSVAEGRRFTGGSKTGGLVDNNYYETKGAGYSNDLTPIRHSYNGGALGGGSVPSSDLVAGGRRLSGGSETEGLRLNDGFETEGLRLNDERVGEGLESSIGSTSGSQLLPSFLSSDDYSEYVKVNYESGETALLENFLESEEGTLSPTLKDNISDIRTAFELAVADKYVGKSNRKLWKELMRKQKQLATTKLQLQHLLYVKREKLRKHYGMSPRHFLPSKALSTSIIKDIDDLLAFRPSDYQY